VDTESADAAVLPYLVLVGRPESKISLGRTRCKWEDNIKMDLQKTGWEGMNGTDMAQDRDKRWAVVNMVLNLQLP
jgi:hypothetical protein